MRQPIQPPVVSEADFQAATMQAATYAGWICHHTRPAQLGKRWVTPLAGSAGFVDVVFVHRSWRLVIFAEFKAEKGRLSANQKTWADALAAAAGGLETRVAYRLWRPSDQDEIDRALLEGQL